MAGSWYASGGATNGGCADFDQEGRPLQLRDVAALLRKGDDPHAVLRGLRVIGPLIKAAPEELSHTAGEARQLAGDSLEPQASMHYTPLW